MVNWIVLWAPLTVFFKSLFIKTNLPKRKEKKNQHYNKNRNNKNTAFKLLNYMWSPNFQYFLLKWVSLSELNLFVWTQRTRIILYAPSVRNTSVYIQTLVKIFMFPYKNSVRRSVLILTCELYFWRSTPEARSQVDCFRHFHCTGCGTDALYVCLTHKTSL